MKVIHTNKQLIHAPEQFMVTGKLQTHPESPERAEILMNAAKKFGLTEESPLNYQLKYISRVHTQRYIHYLQRKNYFYQMRCDKNRNFPQCIQYISEKKYSVLYVILRLW